MFNQRFLAAGIPFLMTTALAIIQPVCAQADGEERHERSEGEAKDRFMIVLYEGPLVHDQNWTIPSGVRGPDNAKLIPLGGNCSLIPNDVSNISASEDITFEAERADLGVWKMVWTDTVAGEATGGNRYTYRRRIEFTGVTTDGRSPKPNRSTPSPGSDGFLQVIPNNVNTSDFDNNDFFLLSDHAGNLVAHSHFHGSYRRQIPPIADDKPPAFLPFVFEGHFILRAYEELAGEVGCDPL